MAKEWIVSEEDLGCDGAYFSHDEVVRCKDCWNSLVIPKEMQNYAERYCEVWCAEMNDDDYCSCGKRREDGK